MTALASFHRARMGGFLAAYVLLFAAAMVMQHVDAGSLLAVTLYKAHLLALGGWGGYWLDRALFPYDRPHTYLECGEPLPPIPGVDHPVPFLADVESVPATFGYAMLRRAIVVAACLVCVGLGA